MLARKQCLDGFTRGRQKGVTGLMAAQVLDRQVDQEGEQISVVVNCHLIKG